MDTQQISDMVANMTNPYNSIFHTSYLTSILRPNKQHLVINQLLSNIKKLQQTTIIDAIAIRGMSGAIVGGIISHLTNIPLICVRKENTSHSDFHVEMVLINPKKKVNYIIVDDLISTGNTLNTIIKDINNEFKRISLDYNQIIKPCPVGIFLYNDSPNLSPNWKVGKRSIPLTAFRISGYGT